MRKVELKVNDDFEKNESESNEGTNFGEVLLLHLQGHVKEQGFLDKVPIVIFASAVEKSVNTEVPPLC